MVALKDESDHVRLYAARALGKLGTASAPALDALTLATTDGNDRVRREAGIALKRIRGIDAAPAIADPE
jgi:HEAT repeat protein